jgi:DeoR family deoxyribose operon repressor
MDDRGRRAVAILSFVKTKGFAKVAEIAEAIRVSPMTARRELRRLEEENLVHLVHGGVMPIPAPEDPSREAPYSLIAEGTHMSIEKTRIGKKAASLLEPDDIVVVDSGTTTEYLAKSLPEDLPLTIICYTLNVVFEVYRRRACKLIFVGGYYHENTMMFESAEGVELLRKLRVGKAFLGATGVHRRFGVTCSNPCEPDVKRAVMGSSMTRVLLVDSSKFGAIRPFHFSELGDFEVVITDRGVPDEYVEAIRKSGKTLHVV